MFSKSGVKKMKVSISAVILFLYIGRGGAWLGDAGTD